MDAQQLTLTPVATTWSLRGTPDLLPPTAPWWLEGVHERSAERAVDDRDPVAAVETGQRPRMVRLAAAIASATAVALVAAAAVGLLMGMRWFVVETPSMGTAAPVGALVITAPAPARLERGEIIAFIPPGNPHVYTHRVFAVAQDGAVRTKGDINGAPDPWAVPRTAVLGRAITVLPGAGYVVRGLPGLVAGGVLLWAATLLIRRRDQRAAARVIGLHLVATILVLWLHPFVRVVLIATESAATGVRASMVSTGLLPVRLVDSAGTVLARLSIGQPEVVPLPASTGAAARVLAVPDLEPGVQALLIGVALLPALIVLLLGLPRPDGAARLAGATA
jgi:signal peptidase I